MERSDHRRLGEHYNRYQKLNTVTSNSESYNNNLYNTVYKPADNLSLNEQVSYATETHFLVISSADRDLDSYPKSNQFVINLQKEYKNIASVELIHAIIPDKNSVTTEPYLLLKINELSTTMDSSNHHISDSFAILQPAPPTTTGGFIQLDKRIAENVILYYETPKASLSKVTVKITNSTGVPFEFGGDTTIDKAYQVTFVLKLVCYVKDRATLNLKNVY